MDIDIFGKDKNWWTCKIRIGIVGQTLKDAEVVAEDLGATYVGKNEIATFYELGRFVFECRYYGRHPSNPRWDGIIACFDRGESNVQTGQWLDSVKFNWRKYDEIKFEK